METRTVLQDAEKIAQTSLDEVCSWPVEKISSWILETEQQLMDLNGLARVERNLELTASLRSMIQDLLDHTKDLNPKLGEGLEVFRNCRQVLIDTDNFYRELAENLNIAQAKVDAVKTFRNSKVGKS